MQAGDRAGAGLCPRLDSAASQPGPGLLFIAGAIACAIKTLFETVIQVNRDLTASDLKIQMELDARRRAKRGW